VEEVTDSGVAGDGVKSLKEGMTRSREPGEGGRGEEGIISESGWKVVVDRKELWYQGSREVEHWRIPGQGVEVEGWRGKRT